jgi:GNAT superfamily N-acetyltransferase
VGDPADRRSTSIRLRSERTGVGEGGGRALSVSGRDQCRSTSLHETVTELRAQPLIFLGASCDRTLAGVLGYRRDGDTVDIDRLAVDPMFFRRGLATRLLRELFARERDATRFTVSTGLGNEPAVGLYERFGFRVVGGAEPAPDAMVVLLRRGPSGPANVHRTMRPNDAFTAPDSDA